MNGVKSQPPEPVSAESGPQVSGKLVIIVVLAVALTGAVVSWYFRYYATHRAAKFWGPAVARVVRDARIVELWRPSDPIVSDRSASLFIAKSDLLDISSAHGLVHLRNALLEDHSYDWPPRSFSPDVHWTQGLQFLDGSTGVLVMFSPDFKFVRSPNSDQMLSCEPIASGLREMFTEFATSSADKAEKAANDPAAQSR